MVRRGLAVAALLLFAALARAQHRPAFGVQPGGLVTATLPVSVLHSPAVRKQLASGLTTTFVVAARQRDRVGGARIEVRFDLWDEVWLVRRIDLDRREDRQRLASMDALEKWWHVPMRIFTTADRAIPLQVDLSVLPFSASEEEDARQWIAKGGGVARPSGGEGLVDVLIGTTLSAKPIIRWRWDVQVASK
jgi:hypothetical protein